MRASIQLNLKSCPLAVNLLIRPAPPSLIQAHFIYMIDAESSIKGFSSPRLPSTPSLLPLTSLIFHPSLLFLHLQNTFLSPSLPPLLLFLPYQFLIENFSFACLPVWPLVQHLAGTLKRRLFNPSIVRRHACPCIHKPGAPPCYHTSAHAPEPSRPLISPQLLCSCCFASSLLSGGEKISDLASLCTPENSASMPSHTAARSRSMTVTA